ncbi:hypothetical protein ZIOFF_003362 [Zingiber officinale]|uniref:Myb/SANT-like domain-containing protein n=1 Tax=Zingiber officinale TaxID=94328 RepID=A0A8J5INK0_ZINOF|nr:hypothetical protein ZIOFF_003362 [Zingiber officinale]
MDTPIEQVKRDVIKWTEEMDRIFIDAMLEQQVNGNRIGDTFTSSAYKDMVVICSEKIEIPLTKDNLKNRIETLKSHFNSCYDLFKNASGVQWHAESRRFEAEEAVWKQLIDANPSIKKWRYTPVPHYEKLLELFAHDRANGQRASTAAERNVEIILEEEQRDLVLDDEHENFKVIPDSPPFDDRSRKRKLASIDSYGSKINAVIDINVKEVVAAIDRSTSVIENRSFHQQNVNEKLYKALVCAGVPDKNILVAYLFLGENKEKTMLFMGCPPKKSVIAIVTFSLALGTITSIFRILFSNLLPYVLLEIAEACGDNETGPVEIIGAVLVIPFVMCMSLVIVAAAVLLSLRDYDSDSETVSLVVALPDDEDTISIVIE